MIKLNRIILVTFILLFSSISWRCSKKELEISQEEMLWLQLQSDSSFLELASIEFPTLAEHNSLRRQAGNDSLYRLAIKPIFVSKMNRIKELYTGLEQKYHGFSIAYLKKKQANKTTSVSSQSRNKVMGIPIELEEVEILANCASRYQYYSNSLTTLKTIYDMAISYCGDERAYLYVLYQNMSYQPTIPLSNAYISIGRDFASLANGGNCTPLWELIKNTEGSSADFDMFFPFQVSNAYGGHIGAALFIMSYCNRSEEEKQQSDFWPYGTGGSDGTGNQNDPDPILSPDIKVSSSASQVEVLNEYFITVSATNLSSPIVNISFEMTRAYQSDNWKGIHEESYTSSPSNPIHYLRKAWTPGFWKIRAVVALQNGTLLQSSNELIVEEQFPAINKFQNNTALRVHLSSTLWSQAINFAQNNQSTHAVREYGCFIYLKPDGSYYVGTTIEGPEVFLVGLGGRGTVLFEYNEFYYDPRNDDMDLLVGTMHTHYPLTWAAPNAGFRPVGPSPDADLVADLPGIGYDYISNVETGHNVNEAKDFFIYGKKRRTTTQ